MKKQEIEYMRKNSKIISILILFYEFLNEETKEKKE